MNKRRPNPHKENILWIIVAIIVGIISEGYCVVVGRTVPLRRTDKKYIFICKLF